MEEETKVQEIPSKFPSTIEQINDKIVSKIMHFSFGLMFLGYLKTIANELKSTLHLSLY